MKTTKRTLIIFSALLISTLSYAQYSEFATVEGIKWDMSPSQVKSYCKGTELWDKADNFCYYDSEQRMTSMYSFKYNKLTLITQMQSYDTEKGMDLGFEVEKEILKTLYGSDYSSKEGIITWTYKGTIILLMKSYKDGKGSVMKFYMPKKNS